MAGPAALMEPSGVGGDQRPFQAIIGNCRDQLHLHSPPCHRTPFREQLHHDVELRPHSPLQSRPLCGEARHGFLKGRPRYFEASANAPRSHGGDDGDVSDDANICEPSWVAVRSADARVRGVVRAYDMACWKNPGVNHSGDFRP